MSALELAGAPVFESVKRGPIVLWRAFMVGTDGVTLRGVAYKARWLPAEVVTAGCEKSAHPAPQVGCSCGLHGYASLADALANAEADHVVAMVAGWGRTVIYLDGARFEHGRIVGLVQREAAEIVDERLRRIAATYQVPLFASVGGL